jgi:hypothetical protein
MNAKNWTGLAAFIILFEDMSGWSNRKVWLFRCVVLFCGLSGPYAAILAPIFALSYFFYPEGERLVQSGILAGCCLIDLGLFLFEMQAGGAGPRMGVFTCDSAIVKCLLFSGRLGVHGRKSIEFCSRFGLADAIHKSYAVWNGARDYRKFLVEVRLGTGMAR